MTTEKQCGKEDRALAHERSARGKSPYESPRLVEFGTLLELTRGTVNGTQDGLANGTENT